MGGVLYKGTYRGMVRARAGRVNSVLDAPIGLPYNLLE
jgi:hypothetical protein